ncbi:MAG: hypothetical protein O4753_02390, partial [Trichodesmium sp. St7_bin2_1]|nr:hypothetical protein [Trichodesmium sp. St7_bin2_1]
LILTRQGFNRLFVLTSHGQFLASENESKLIETLSGQSWSKAEIDGNLYNRFSNQLKLFSEVYIAFWPPFSYCYIYYFFFLKINLISYRTYAKTLYIAHDNFDELHALSRALIELSLYFLYILVMGQDT